MAALRRGGPRLMAERLEKAQVDGPLDGLRA